MKWKNFGIRLKIALVFSAVLALMLLLGLFSLRGLNRVDAKASEALRLADVLGEMKQREVDHLKWAGKLSTFVTTPEMTRLDIETDPTKCGLGKWYYSEERKKAEALLPEISGYMGEIEKAHNALHQSAAEILRARTSGDFLGPARIYDEKTVPALSAVQELLHKTGGAVIKASQNIESDFVATARRTNGIALALLAASVPLALFLGFVLANSISSPAKKGVAFAEKMAAGDLSARIELDRTDEIGMLAASLNKMADSIGIMISSIRGDMTQLASSSEQLTHAAGELKDYTKVTAERSSDVARRTMNISDHMTRTASSVIQTSGNVQMVAAAAEELTATITEIAARTAQAKTISEAAVKTAERTTLTVDTLSSAATEIGKVTKTISDISEQTKLLALNATIEAARAGEAGRGFAVVANEIKELARQVAVATGDIAKRIEAMTDATASTKSGIDSMGSVIKDVNEMVLTIAAATEQQSATVRDIARNAQEVSTAMEDVSSVVADTTTATMEVNQDALALSSEAEKFVSVAADLDGSAVYLKGVAVNLTQLCGRFSTN